MQRSPIFLCSLLLTLGACHVQPVSPPNPIRPVRPSVEPSQTAGDRPTGGALTMVPSAKPTPSVPTRTLAGTLALDGNYLLSAAAGLISNNGGGLISDHGSGALAELGLGLLPGSGAAVIALEDGTTVQVGNGVISNNGGGVVSNNGGNIVIGGRTRYSLAATSTSLPLGTLVGVSGMAVVPVSLLTGKPLGPAVFSGAGGAFKVTVPTSVAESVRLLAKVPTARADDALQSDTRLSYSVYIKPSSDSAHPIDEDTAATAVYLRRIAVGKLLFLFSPAQIDNQTNLLDPSFTGPVQLLVNALADELRAAIKAAKAPPEKLPVLARRSTDIVSAYIDFEQVPLDRINTAWKESYGDLKAVAALGSAVRQLREAATVKMRTDAHYFEQKHYFLAANSARIAAGLAPHKIEKPADFFEFVLEEYLAVDGAKYDGIDEVLLDLGLSERDESGLILKTKLAASGKSVFLGFATTLLTNAQAKAGVLELIRTSENL